MAIRSSRTSDAAGLISVVEARRVLGVLCSKYGFCLPPLWNARLEKNPPRSVAKFTDTVFRAEGFDPATADSALSKSILAEVQEGFERSARIMERNRNVVPAPNKQLQRTVMDKVPNHIRQRAAAELRR
ncbi:MAG: hypothetical protein E8D47_02475 [Nitrospira sp.]|nr:MAG: hypothetical protein E8D47_02475 [Nitrospira sp.]